MAQRTDPITRGLLLVLTLALPATAGCQSDVSYRIDAGPIVYGKLRTDADTVTVNYGVTLKGADDLTFFCYELPSGTLVQNRLGMRVDWGAAGQVYVTTISAFFEQTYLLNNGLVLGLEVGAGGVDVSDDLILDGIVGGPYLGSSIGYSKNAKTGLLVEYNYHWLSAGSSLGSLSLLGFVTW